LKDGTLIIEGDEGCNHEDLNNWRINCFRSEDEGKTWSDKILVAHKNGLKLNEGSIVELDDGTLVDYIRGYRISREDWCLWPADQSLPGYNKGAAHDSLAGVTDMEKLYASTYREETVEMTRRSLMGKQQNL